MFLAALHGLQTAVARAKLSSCPGLSPGVATPLLLMASGVEGLSVLSLMFEFSTLVH